MRSLDNRIKEVFDQVHADPSLKERTTRQVLHAMEARRRPARGVFNPVCALASCCLLLLLVLGGYRF